MLVFVYGSLKRGFPLHSILQNAPFIGETTLDGYTLHSAGSFPYMIPCHCGTVKGEVYDVDSFDTLDRIESEGNLYTREVVAQYDGKEVYSYLAKSIQDPGFSDWNNQTDDSDLREELLPVVISLLEDGIDYNIWLELENLINDNELSNYVRETEGTAYLDYSYWNRD